MVVGGYTADAGGRAVGVSCYRSGTGQGTAGRAGGPVFELVDTLELLSPSYLVAHPVQPWLFAVSEADPALVSSLELHRDGSLRLLDTVPTGGDGACHLALSPDLTRLAVANYGSGSVSSFGVDGEGRLSRQDVWQLTGQGPDPERQAGPHAHQVVWHGEELLVCDLGTDRVHRLRPAADGRLTEAAPPIALPAGSGPRHLVLLGEHLAVACELSGELWLARRGADGGWSPLPPTPTSTSTSNLPEGGPVQPSALVSDGSRLFVANRGPGTVSVFGLDGNGESRLVRISEFPCGGASPRDLTVSEEHLWVAHPDEDLVSVFALASGPGAEPAFTLSAPTPTCVVLPPRTGR